VGEVIIALELALGFIGPLGCNQANAMEGAKEIVIAI